MQPHKLKKIRRSHLPRALPPLPPPFRLLPHPPLHPPHDLRLTHLPFHLSPLLLLQLQMPLQLLDRLVLRLTSGVRRAVLREQGAEVVGVEIRGREGRQG